jgi:hypothetical protein
MSHREGPEPDPAEADPADPWSVDRAAYEDDDLPGRPLSTLVFTCADHQEDKIIQYYDPGDPPRCSHGDFMVRKAS